MSFVVGVDFSDGTKAVISVAADLARRFGCELVVVHVATPDPDFVGYGAGPQHERDGRAMELHGEHEMLNAIVEGLRNNGVNAWSRLMMGTVVAKILEESTRVDAELIIVGSHGHGLLHHVLVGNVPEGLLRKSERPVVVVPAAKRRGGRDGL